MTDERTWGLRKRAIDFIPVLVGVLAARRFENLVEAIVVFLAFWFLTRVALVAVGLIDVGDV